jgi:hypothetical protein
MLCRHDQYRKTMIRHDKIARPPHTFKTLTGLSTEGFDQLLVSFDEAWESNLNRRDAAVWKG